MADRPTNSNDDAPSDPVTEELVAFLDGELDPAAAEAMRTKISLDPKLRAQADALQRTWDILDVIPRPKPSPTFATKTISQIAAIPAVPGATSGPGVSPPAAVLGQVGPGPAAGLGQGAGMGSSGRSTIPAPLSPSSSHPMANPATGIGAQSTAAMPIRRPPPGIGFWVAAVLMIAAAGIGGFAVQSLVAANRAARIESDNNTAMLNDLKLLQNLRMYRHVDDMDFLKQLDTPDLFHEDD